MKAGEWVSAFRYERARPEVEWLNTPTSYSNREAVEQALSTVGPGWVGLSAARPRIPDGAQLPDNSMQTVLGSYLAFLPDLLREGG